MRSLLHLILLQTGIICSVSAQNYFYVHGKMDTTEKAELSGLVQNWSQIYNMKDVTIAVMKCRLPKE